MMKSFRIVVAGCGVMANIWVEYALSRVDAKIVALVDIKRKNAKALAARHGLNSKIYSDVSEAIKDSDANLVFNITSPVAHREIVIKSLRLGCNVLGEKPMANSIEEAEEMVKAAEESGCTYAVMQNRRYNKNIRALKELLTSETTGKPTFICADFFLGPHFGGFRDLMEHPLLLDMSIHTFDQARFITGADAVSVYCHEFNPSGSWYRGDASAACIFKMSDGSVFSYRGSWCAEGAPTSWESFWRITGAKGTAIWDGSTLPYCEVPVPSKEHNLLNDYKRIEGKASWQGRDGHFGCLDEMFSALLEGRKAETDCTDNIKSMTMVFASLESAEKQRKIKILA
jgi:predicted dehydrogenase